MDNVLVLLSSFNGEKYIKQQITSILEQKDVKVNILVRDDGSSDNTKNILEEYQKDSRVSICYGKNLGTPYSFFELLVLASEDILEYDFFAFADQDDIWMPNKLFAAVTMLKENRADLYCGSLCCYNEDCTVVQKINTARKYSDFELLLRNSVAGCTMVLNKNVLNRIVEYKPTYMEMHDSWILRVCTYTNMRIVYDTEPYIKYRVHGNNQCGATIDYISKLRIHLNNLFRDHSTELSKCSENLLKGYKEYIHDDILECISSFYLSANKRKYRLFIYGLSTKFSTISRKVDFLWQVIIGRI